MVIAVSQADDHHLSPALMPSRTGQADRGDAGIAARHYCCHRGCREFAGSGDRPDGNVVTSGRSYPKAEEAHATTNNRRPRRVSTDFMQTAFSARYCSSDPYSIHSTVLPSSSSENAMCDIPLAAVASCQCFTPGWDPHDVARPNFLNRAFSHMNKAGAYGDDQGLTKWVDMQAVRAPGL